MTRHFRILLILFGVLLGMVSTCSAAETQAGTYVRSNTGIREIKSIDLQRMEDGLFDLLVTGIAEHQGAEVYLTLRDSQNGVIGTDDPMPIEGTEFMRAVYGLELDDGWYFVALSDIKQIPNPAKAGEAGYKVVFEVKDNQVLPGWERKASVNQEQNQSGSDTGTITAVPENSQKAKEDIAGHWAELQIRQALEKGIVTGYKDGSFRPDAKVTRAEFAQIVQNAFQFKREGKPGEFDDVSAEAWYFNAVTALYENKVVSGVSAVRFAPEETITREQMAVILYHASEAIPMDLAVKREYIPFTDSGSISDYAASAVRAMYQAEIINGVKSSDGLYRYEPQEGATRAEVVTLIQKLLNQN